MMMILILVIIIIIIIIFHVQIEIIKFERKRNSDCNNPFPPPSSPLLFLSHTLFLRLTPSHQQKAEICLHM